jgi:hypothetical protein
MGRVPENGLYRVDAALTLQEESNGEGGEAGIRAPPRFGGTAEHHDVCEPTEARLCVRRAKVGGEAGIRTLGRAFRPYNGLANRRLQPLGHLTANGKYTVGKHLRDPVFLAAPTTVFGTVVCIEISRKDWPIRARTRKTLGTLVKTIGNFRRCRWRALCQAAAPTWRCGATARQGLALKRAAGNTGLLNRCVVPTERVNRGDNPHAQAVLAVAINPTVVGKTLTVGSALWLAAESVAPDR